MLEPACRHRIDWIPWAWNPEWETAFSDDHLHKPKFWKSRRQAPGTSACDSGKSNGSTFHHLLVVGFDLILEYGYTAIAVHSSVCAQGAVLGLSRAIILALMYDGPKYVPRKAQQCQKGNKDPNLLLFWASTQKTTKCWGDFSYNK